MKIISGVHALFKPAASPEERLSRSSKSEKQPQAVVEKEFTVTISNPEKPNQAQELSMGLTEHEKQSAAPPLPQRGYGFRITDNSRTVMVVTDKESGEVVKEIPNEEQQKIYANLKRATDALN
ncbi:MAG: flagellar protein FlaG [Nitrospinota bacterium]